MDGVGQEFAQQLGTEAREIGARYRVAYADPKICDDLSNDGLVLTG